jgi:MFS transporter, FSR family, fosmidomycin resistance protein
MQDRKRKLRTAGVLSFAHLVNDWYMNFFQTALPVLALSLGVARASWLVTAFTVTSSIVQPLFGLWLGKHKGRWPLLVGTLWMAVLLGLSGLCRSYPLCLALASLAGLGTAVFHPAASAMVAGFGESRKSFLQSIFVAGGNVGWALAPLAMLPFLDRFGIGASPWLILPGAFVSLVMLVFLPSSSPKAVSGAERKPEPKRSESDTGGGLPRPLRNGQIRELATILVVVACRSLCYFGLISFLPLYLGERGLSLLTGGRLLFVMLFCGAAGGIVGGALADRLGGKRVLVGSLALACPLFFLFDASGGMVGAVFLGLAGACLLGSFSITIVMAQGIFERNPAFASGLTLGLATGVGGLGIGVLGSFLSRTGPRLIVVLLMLLPLSASLLGLSLHAERRA